MNSDEIVQMAQTLGEECKRQKIEIARLQATIDDAVTTMEQITKMVNVSNKASNWVNYMLFVIGVSVGWLGRGLL